MVTWKIPGVRASMVCAYFSKFEELPVRGSSRRLVLPASRNLVKEISPFCGIGSSKPILAGLLTPSYSSVLVLSLSIQPCKSKKSMEDAGALRSRDEPVPNRVLKVLRELTCRAYTTSIRKVPPVLSDIKKCFSMSG